MQTIHIDGWERIPQGNYLRCLLVQLCDEVAYGLLNKNFSIHWKIDLRLDTYVIRAVSDATLLITLCARFNGRSFHFLHDDSPITLQQIGEIIQALMKPVEEPVGI